MGRKDSSNPSQTNKSKKVVGGGGRGRGGRDNTSRQPSTNGSSKDRPSTQKTSDDKNSADLSTSSSFSGGTTANRPRNWLLHDATSDVVFRFETTNNKAKSTSSTAICEIRVHQTPAEETWPGGALWDSGILLAQLFAVLPMELSTSSSPKQQPTRTGPREPRIVTLTSGTTVHHRHAIRVPSRLLECEDIALRIGRCSPARSTGSSTSSRPTGRRQPSSASSQRPVTVLELGCGVGLTGMVAAISLRASVTLLTDLSVVVDHVTQPNLQRNLKVLRRHGAGIVRAVPLCWGCQQDERHVGELLRQLAPENTVNSARSRIRAPTGTPDWILVGDVAYQHRPGAPSHFDQLLSTLLHFTSPPPSSHLNDECDESDKEPTSFVAPIVVFGTRIRMPASVDLLNLLLEHFDPWVDDPPLEADEINDAFGAVKHNMTVHFLRRKVNVHERRDGNGVNSS